MTAVYHYYYESTDMDEDWGLVKNDCLLFSPSLNEDHLLVHPSDSLLSLNSDGGHIKLEPEDGDSDYHTSSSNSPSSLCDSAGVCDYSPLILTSHTSHPSFPSINHHPILHSPSSSNCSHGVMPMGGDGLTSMGSSLSPLPSVTHFSHYSHSSPTMVHTYGMDDDKPSHILVEPKDEPCSQMEVLSSAPSSPSSPISPSPHSSPVDALYHHRLQIRTRSKMHEMALHHRLITEQDPRGSGHVQLSAEEKRTLIQEGYSIPSKLPLTKAEEEALRIVRRKIKNKLSAQESRRKRKEYIDTLEQRCQVYANENAGLKQRLKQMEAQLRKITARV